jgi:hypothetical protein
MTGYNIKQTIEISKAEKYALVKMLDIGARLVNTKMHEACRAAAEQGISSVEFPEFGQWRTAQYILQDFFEQLSKI